MVPRTEASPVDHCRRNHQPYRSRCRGRTAIHPRGSGTAVSSIRGNVSGPWAVPTNSPACRRRVRLYVRDTEIRRPPTKARAPGEPRSGFCDLPSAYSRRPAAGEPCHLSVHSPVRNPQMPVRTDCIDRVCSGRVRFFHSDVTGYLTLC